MAIKIFIDQGHNPSGPNTGAEGFGLKEQDITYQVGKELAALLRADERFEVRLSRNTPEERLGTSNATSLAARVRAAKSRISPSIKGSAAFIATTSPSLLPVM